MLSYGMMEQICDLSFHIYVCMPTESKVTLKGTRCSAFAKSLTLIIGINGTKISICKKKYIFRKMTNADISLVLTCDVITLTCPKI